MLFCFQHYYYFSTILTCFFQRLLTEESSDDELGSESPLDEIAVAPEFDSSMVDTSAVFPPSSLALREATSQIHSSNRSDTR